MPDIAQESVLIQATAPEGVIRSQATPTSTALTPCSFAAIAM